MKRQYSICVELYRAFVSEHGYPKYDFCIWAIDWVVQTIENKDSHTIWFPLAQ